MNIRLFPEIIEINKNKRNIIETLPNTVLYSPSLYGINNKCTGKGVKIAILDSGCPSHKDIMTEGEKVSLCENNIGIEDKNGHATMVSGVIKANNKNSIIGTAPHAQLLFGRVLDNKGKCGFNSLVAGVLWAIVKEVDIIVVAMGTQYDYMILHDAIKKAREYGICLFSASGENDEIDYPAKYKETFSVGFLTKSKIKNEKIKKNVDFYLPNNGLYTTYLNNKYVKISGSSISTGFFAGLAAVLIEQYKREKKRNLPELVYSKLKNI